MAATLYMFQATIVTQNMYTDLTSQVQKDALRKAIELFVLQIVRLFYHCNFVISNIFTNNHFNSITKFNIFIF